MSVEIATFFVNTMRKGEPLLCFTGNLTSVAGSLDDLGPALAAARDEANRIAKELEGRVVPADDPVPDAVFPGTTIKTPFRLLVLSPVGDQPLAAVDVQVSVGLGDTTMAGYWVYDEYEGEAVHRMYTNPWVVRGTDRGEGVTVAAFPTQEKAQAFKDAGAGGWGKDNVTIENWNE